MMLMKLKKKEQMEEQIKNYIDNGRQANKD
jgi:hypothetical protein